MAYHINWQEKGCYWQFSDTLIGTELIESAKRVYGAAAFDGMHYQIADFSLVNKFNVSDSDIALLAAYDSAASHSNHRSKMAVVGSCEEFLTIFNQYTAKSKACFWKIRRFESFDEAYCWCVDD